ncbi:unnamed protein product, partial [Vitis vinifera]
MTPSSSTIQASRPAASTPTLLSPLLTTTPPTTLLRQAGFRRMISVLTMKTFSHRMDLCFHRRLKCSPRKGSFFVNGGVKMLFSWRRRRRGRKKCETRLLKKLRSINELSMRNERSTLRLTRLITEKERSYTWLIKRSFIKRQTNSIGKQ